MSKLQSLALVAALCCTTSAQAAPVVKKLRLTMTHKERTRQIDVALLRGTVKATRRAKNLSYTAEGAPGVLATLRKDLLALTSVYGRQDGAPAEASDPLLEVWYTDGSKATVDTRARMGNARRVGERLLELEAETIKAAVRRDHLARIERDATAALINLSVAYLPSKPLKALTQVPSDPKGLGPRVVLEIYSSSRAEPERWSELEALVLDAGGPGLEASARAVNDVLRRVLDAAQLQLRSLRRVGIHASRWIEALEVEALTRAIRAASKVGVARLRRDLGPGLGARTRVVILGTSVKSTNHVRVRSGRGRVRVVDVRDLDVEIRLDGFVPIEVPGLRALDARGAAGSIP